MRTPHCDTKFSTESLYMSHCLAVISLLNTNMHDVIPTNEHQDGIVDCNVSCDCNESLASTPSSVIGELLSESTKFLRPDHMLISDVHTVLPGSMTVAYRSQLCEGWFKR